MISLLETQGLRHLANAMKMVIHVGKNVRTLLQRKYHVTQGEMDLMSNDLSNANFYDRRVTHSQTSMNYCLNIVLVPCLGYIFSNNFNLGQKNYFTTRIYAI